MGWVLLKKILNIIGRYKGYSGCPNCGDSWFWKDKNHRGEFIEFKRERVGVGISSTGIPICIECASTPEKFDAKRIMRNLKKTAAWSREDTILAEKALETYIQKRSTET